MKSPLERVAGGLLRSMRKKALFMPFVLNIHFSVL
jgi:hypothetical protein